MQTEILELVMRAISALIQWASEQIGEDTATVRGRVLARLAAPSTDSTDAVAASIAEAIKGASPK